MLKENKEQENKNEVKFNIRKFKLSEEAFIKIEGWGMVPFNSWLTRTLKKELMLIVSQDYRVERVLNLKQVQENKIEKHNKFIKLTISDYNDKALSILKEWTGIQKSEYLDMLLKSEIIELDYFTVAQLAAKTDSSQNTINSYIDRFPEFFPFKKIINQRYYTNIALDIINELKKHKYVRKHKIQPILTEKFGDVLQNSQTEYD